VVFLPDSFGNTSYATDLKEEFERFGIDKSDFIDVQGVYNNNIPETTVRFLDFLGQPLFEENDVFLIGYSAGGPIAYQMAIEAEKVGLKVAGLGIIDAKAYESTNIDSITGALLSNAKHIAEKFGLAFNEEGFIAYIYQTLENIQNKTVKNGMRLPSIVDTYINYFQTHKFNNQQPSDNHNINQFYDHLDAIKHNLRAIIGYNPKGAVHSNIQYFSAASYNRLQRNKKAKVENIFAGGWENYTVDGFGVSHTRINADHFDMVKGEHAHKIVKNVFLNLIEPVTGIQRRPSMDAAALQQSRLLAQLTKSILAEASLARQNQPYSTNGNVTPPNQMTSYSEPTSQKTSPKRNYDEIRRNSEPVPHSPEKNGITKGKFANSNDSSQFFKEIKKEKEIEKSSGEAFNESQIEFLIIDSATNGY